ncbi:uncharacterized protein LOC111373208 [Olea europaea var. sylvestris]|uniref:uncharacterized protein LOC111373208 n=1 Tax=Olea europaea var. sylvestris TaxID=158386 RepID=UPI000C1D823E|nr:uncharacterized protein LOC111373208 [Olea europaea var. sylvestris]
MRMLVKLCPLFSSMKEIEEEVIDLADVRGVEGMSFDPRALRNFVNSRANAQPQGQPLARKKSKKRPRGPQSNHMVRGPGKRSRPQPEPPSPRFQQSQRSPTCRVTPRAPSEVVDLEDDITSMVALIIEEFERCHLVPSLVTKYREDVELDEGVKALELFTTKVLSVARGVTQRGLGESKRIADITESSRSKDMRIVEVEAEHEAWLKEREDILKENKNLRNEVGAAKDEAEEAKLELVRKTKEFEDKMAKVKERAWEEFKTSEDCDRIKGEYASGAYLHAFKEARAFLRARLPDVIPKDLKTVPSIADTLELSEFDDGGANEEDDGMEGGEAEDADDEIDITNLDPPLGHIG